MRIIPSLRVFLRSLTSLLVCLLLSLPLYLLSQQIGADCPTFLLWNLNEIFEALVLVLARHEYLVEVSSFIIIAHLVCQVIYQSNTPITYAK